MQKVNLNDGKFIIFRKYYGIDYAIYENEKSVLLLACSFSSRCR